MERQVPAVYMVFLLQCDYMMRFIGYDSIQSGLFISYHFQIALLVLLFYVCPSKVGPSVYLGNAEIESQYSQEKKNTKLN